MGNCIRIESSMQSEDDHLLMEEDKESIHSSTPAGSVKEIKIKITKKQLSELIGKAEVQGIPVHQLLTQLMKVSESPELRHRSWRPALHSIPEDN